MEEAVSVVNETGRDLGGKAEATADVPPRRLSWASSCCPDLPCLRSAFFSIRFVWQPTTATKPPDTLRVENMHTLRRSVTSSSGMVIEPTVLGEIDECDMWRLWAGFWRNIAIASRP
ncbi:transcriptional regulator [Brucella melitensis]|nr:transcriptional regulator [Brucella melitensis]